MITTVTTTTVTTVTTFGALSLASFAIITLVLLLIAKETLINTTTEQSRRLSRVLNIAIVPLVIVFLFTLVTQVLKVIG